jgi:hypothetical protein
MAVCVGDTGDRQSKELKCQGLTNAPYGDAPRVEGAVEPMLRAVPGYLGNALQRVSGFDVKLVSVPGQLTLWFPSFALSQVFKQPSTGGRQQCSLSPDFITNQLWDLAKLFSPSAPFLISLIKQEGSHRRAGFIRLLFVDRDFVVCSFACFLLFVLFCFVLFCFVLFFNSRNSSNPLHSFSLTSLPPSCHRHS